MIQARFRKQSLNSWAFSEEKSLRAHGRVILGVQHKPSWVISKFFKLPKYAAFLNIWGFGCGWFFFRQYGKFIFQVSPFLGSCFGPGMVEKENEVFFQVPFPKAQTERWGPGPPGCLCLGSSRRWEPLNGRARGLPCTRLYTFAVPSIQHLWDRKPARFVEPDSQIKRDHFLLSWS